MQGELCECKDRPKTKKIDGEKKPNTDRGNDESLTNIPASSSANPLYTHTHAHKRNAGTIT